MSRGKRLSVLSRGNGQGYGKDGGEPPRKTCPFSAFPQPRLLLVYELGHNASFHSKLATDLACFGIKPNQKLVRQGDTNYLLRLSRLA